MTQRLDLGDARLDADHAQLERLIDGLASAAAAQRLDAFDALEAHAASHFALEDEEIREMKDGNATCHLDEHAAVLRSLREVREIIAPDPGNQAAGALLSRLTAELRRWLPEHVLSMDASVAHTRTRRRLGGVPVVLTRR